MIFSSWNVNGLRSVSGKGFTQWLNENLPDIVALQEIKAQETDVLKETKLWSNLYEIHLFPAQRKGYSGTGLLIKKNISDSTIAINRGLKQKEFDDEGRLIWSEHKNFIFINGYFPNGGRDLSRVKYKLDFSRRVLKLALNLYKTQ